MKRNKTGKVLSLALSAALAVSLVFSGMPAAFADSGSAADSGKTSAVFAGSGSASGSIKTSAETNETSASRGGLTLNQMVKETSGSAADDPARQASSGSPEKDPLEDTVVVLMADDSLTTEKKVRKALSVGDDAVKDITVEEVWDFNGAANTAGSGVANTAGSGAANTAGSGSGLRLKSEDAAACRDDAVVALVSSDSMSAAKLVRKLNKRSDVEIAEKNFKVHALSVSDDAYSDYQWSMQSRDNAPNVEYEWNEKGTTGTEKIVAIVDTGVDYTHPDLKDNMWVNTHRQIKGEHGFDFIAGDPDPMDENGHGTHCAGIIGAIGNNQTGISGVCQNVKIMALRVLDSDGSSWLSHELAAYNYINKAIDLGEPVVAVNNSWGGGDYSEIFAKLINIIGEKGAATVCAAGNEGVSNDEVQAYPRNIDSPYIITVGATDKLGELADFSNYGESVDIAAPGTDILSTMPFYIYNPSIYGSRQSRVSKEYNSYTKDSDKFCVPETFYVNGEECVKVRKTFYGKNGEEIKVEKANEGFADGDARSLKITMKNVKKDDVISFLTPYEVENDAKSKPVFSVMSRVEAPEKASDEYSSSIFFIADMAKGETPDFDTLGELELAGYQVGGKHNRWSHIYLQGNEDSKAGDSRYFVTSIYSVVNGDYMLQLDDAGISRQDIQEERFEKYDYMSGTSMATPFITGAVALKVAEQEKLLGDGETVNIADVLNEMSAMAKSAPKLKIRPEGAFDFRLIPEVLPPRVGKVTVDTDSDTIKISGSGLYADRPGFKVEVGKDDDHMKEAEIIPVNGVSDGKEVLIKNEKWINNVVKVRVTTGDGKTSAKNSVYLVKGKKEYEARDNVIELSGEAMCIDGKNLYTAWSMGSEIRRQDLTDSEGFNGSIATVTASDLFEINKDPNVKYGMLFGKDLVYANGLLYNVVEYGAADEMEESDDGNWIFSDNANKDNKDKSGRSGKNDDEGGGFDEDGVDEFDGPFAIYAGEYKLISIETDSEESEENEVKDLGALPEELAELDDFTIAAYFGKLYFIGGSRGYGESRKFSRKVFVYDPKTGKWSSGPSLPAPRAGGKALQYRDKLIYTLGEESVLKSEPEDENDFSAVLPRNLIFDGTSWRACSAEPIVKMYEVDELSVGLTEKGLIYAGAPVRDYGDTFIYDIAEDRYVDTGYNYLLDPEEYGPTAFTCGSTLYGVMDGDLYTIPIKSGYANVTVSKIGKGKVTGAGASAPGNDVRLTFKAAKNHSIKSISIDGKAVKVKPGTTKQTVTIPKLIKNAKVSVTFAEVRKYSVTVKKSGKGKVTGAGKYAAGKNVKIKATANKGYYIKSFKIGSKNIKLGKKTTKKVYTIKKLNKSTKVTVTFAKK